MVIQWLCGEQRSHLMVSPWHRVQVTGQPGYGLGKHYSFYFTNCYDGEISLFSTLLGSCRFNVIIDRGIYINHLACRKDLSHRYFALWEKTKLERDDQVDTTLLIS